MFCVLNKDYPCIIQVLISLSPYLAAVQTWHCDVYSKCLQSEVCVNLVPYLFSDLSLKANQPVARQKRE